jgi:hypothetical protein
MSRHTCSCERAGNVVQIREDNLTLNVSLDRPLGLSGAFIFKNLWMPYLTSGINLRSWRSLGRLLRAWQKSHLPPQNFLLLHLLRPGDQRPAIPNRPATGQHRRHGYRYYRYDHLLASLMECRTAESRDRRTAGSQNRKIANSLQTTSTRPTVTARPPRVKMPTSSCFTRYTCCGRVGIAVLATF